MARKRLGAQAVVARYVDTGAPRTFKLKNIERVKPVKAG